MKVWFLEQAGFYNLRLDVFNPMGLTKSLSFSAFLWLKVNNYFNLIITEVIPWAVDMDTFVAFGL